MYSQVESLERERLRLLQDERLRKMISYVSEKVPFYQDMFKRLGFGKIISIPKWSIPTQVSRCRMVKRAC
jgi:phenylacetate-coenzyme A ligase PaaK-like adenylate-forming protein